MRKLRYILLTCAMMWCLIVVCERPAYAYVDPGSGLFLLQGIGSAFLGVIYVARRKLRLIKSPHTKADEGSVGVSTEAGA